VFVQGQEKRLPGWRGPSVSLRFAISVYAGYAHTVSQTATKIRMVIKLDERNMFTRELFTPPIGVIDVCTHTQSVLPHWGCVYYSSGVFLHNVGF